MHRIIKPSLTCFLVFVMFSCQNYKKTTFLDFQFGMTYDEFYNHALSLQKSRIITNFSGKSFEYTLTINNNKPIFLRCQAEVYGNARLTSIACNLKYSITQQERDAIINMLTSKYGTPSYPLTVNQSYPDVSNIQWDLKDNAVNVRVGNEMPTYDCLIEYRASGTLYDNIQKKDKKESKDIDVKNKY